MISNQLQTNKAFSQEQADLLAQVFHGELQRVEGRVNTTISNISSGIFQQVASINERISSIDEDQKRIKEDLTNISKKQDDLLDRVGVAITTAIQNSPLHAGVTTLGQNVESLVVRFDAFQQSIERFDERLKRIETREGLQT
jgi:hypothetical protein